MYRSLSRERNRGMDPRRIASLRNAPVFYRARWTSPQGRPQGNSSNDSPATLGIPRFLLVPPPRVHITGRAKSGHWVSRWLRFVARLDEEIEIGLSCSFIRRIAAKVVRDRYFYYDFSSNGANSTRYSSEIVCRSLLISSLLDREPCVLRLFHLIFKFYCIVFEDDYIYVLKKVTDKLKKYSTI